MQEKSNIQKGVGDPVTILVIVLVLLLAGALLYFGLGGRLGTRDTTDTFVTDTTTPVPDSEVPVSESDEIGVLEAELEATDPGTFEADVQMLEQEASPLY